LLAALVGSALCYDARWLDGARLTVLSLVVMHMTSFDLEVDFRGQLARVMQAAGLACLFVAITPPPYAFLPRRKTMLHPD